MCIYNKMADGGGVKEMVQVWIVDWVGKRNRLGQDRGWVIKIKLHHCPKSGPTIP